jgi:predicted DsbA family dithiol-disulfide isomerase
MHSALFEDQKRMDDASLVKRAQVLKLNEDVFRTCFEGAMRSQVDADSRHAAALGLSGTPAFLFGTRTPDGRVKVSQVLVGTQPFEEFQKALDAAARRGGSPPLNLWVWLPGIAIAAIVGLSVLTRRARRATARNVLGE